MKPLKDMNTTKPSQTEKGLDPNALKTPLKERGGRTGPEPTRYGDWEKNGVCTDF